MADCHRGNGIAIRLDSLGRNLITYENKNENETPFEQSCRVFAG